MQGRFHAANFSVKPSRTPVVDPDLSAVPRNKGPDDEEAEAFASAVPEPPLEPGKEPLLYPVRHPGTGVLDRDPDFAVPHLFLLPQSRFSQDPAEPRRSHLITGTKPNLPNPGGQTPCIDGMVEVPRLVLIDVETGTRVRHRIRSIRQALKQQEWYETVLGRHVRIEKVFDR